MNSSDWVLLGVGLWLVWELRRQTQPARAIRV